MAQPLHRGDAMADVANAVDRFIVCSRAVPGGDLGQSFVDPAWDLSIGYGSYRYCGAVVHWNADMAAAMKSCLDRRSFGEDVDRLRSHRRGVKRYVITYDCGDFWLNLLVDVTGREGAVVGMDMGEKP